jgi:hypothetical protein
VHAARTLVQTETVCSAMETFADVRVGDRLERGRFFKPGRIASSPRSRRIEIGTRGVAYIRWTVHGRPHSCRGHGAILGADETAPVRIPKIREPNDSVPPSDVQSPPQRLVKPGCQARRRHRRLSFFSRQSSALRLGIAS